MANQKVNNNNVFTIFNAKVFNGTTWEDCFFKVCGTREFDDPANITGTWDWPSGATMTRGAGSLIDLDSKPN